MTATTIALAEYRRRKALVRRLVTEAAQLWRRVDRRDIGRSWGIAIPRVFALLYAAQVVAAQDADVYLDAMLTAQDIDPAAVGRFNHLSLAGVASDGRPLGTLLEQPVIAAKTALAGGASESRAMAVGEVSLTQILGTQVADSARVASGVALVARRDASGYVRMVVGATCSRCVVLAGKFYRWNRGFRRHPKCNCIHVPSREDRAGDVSTDPKALFDSLSPAEQDRVFTKAGAQAIRDGADMSRVVNARRGMETAARAEGRTGGRLTTRDVFGRQLHTTTEAVTKRGINRPVRLMPESIYDIAGNDRGEALRLLRAHGYIT